MQPNVGFVATCFNETEFLEYYEERKIRGPFFQENSTLFLTGDEVQRTSSLFSSNRNKCIFITFADDIDMHRIVIGFHFKSRAKKKTLAQC